MEEAHLNIGWEIMEEICDGAADDPLRLAGFSGSLHREKYFDRSG